MNPKTVKSLDELTDFILYGDIHEVPLAILKDFSENKMETMDEEQQTRIYIAACIQQLQKYGYFLGS